MRKPLVAAALAGAALLPAGAAASGAVRPKAPDPPAGGGQVAFERAAPGGATLLVTFADAPGEAQVAARMAGIGPARPVVPEAGVWSVRPARPATARAQALGRPQVAGAEWSLARTSDERPPLPTPPGPAPAFTDPLFQPRYQWGLFGATTWGPDLTTVGPRPRIAILDSGIDVSHPEWGGPDTPLVAPRSTIRNDGNADDHSRSGHGTNVAGIAAAPANGIGIVGVAPASATSGQVIPVQISDAEGASTDETMMKGIRYAVMHGAKIINISAGGPGFSRAFQDTVLFAASRGATIVASVGNQGQDLNALNYPAGYSRVLGVAAQCDGITSGPDLDQPSIPASVDCPRPYGVATFSNHNRTVDVIAPGVDVISTVPLNVTDNLVAPGYGLKDGTSMAAPFVAGVAALVQAANGNRLSPYQVERQIENTAVPIDGRKGRNDVSGFGLVNPRGAVTLPAPADDPGEIDDDIKWIAHRPSVVGASGRAVFHATIDRFEDPDDVYPVYLRRGERVTVTLSQPTGVLDVYLWRPGTKTVRTESGNVARNLVRYRAGRARVIVRATAERSGMHYVDVYARRGGTAYDLTITRRR